MRWAGVSILFIPVGASARSVVGSADLLAMVKRSRSLQELPCAGACGLGGTQFLAVGSVVGCACCSEGVDGTRRLPQFKQKLSPGRVSALQKGHLSIVDVPSRAACSSASAKAPTP